MTYAGEVATTKIYVTDFFDIPGALLDDYGAFNVSLINDLPLFIDPFLLFHSADPTYQQLHEGIIRYLRFLRDESSRKDIDPALMKAWYYFKEVKQTWLGFSLIGNSGHALAYKFAKALHAGLRSIFKNFGEETVPRGSHLEKVCLLAPGVGRDNISDFTTSLIKHFLLEYTQRFAQTYLRERDRGIFTVPKARFNYETQSWRHGRYELPRHAGDYIILTPKNMLTRDDTWISRGGLLDDFEQIAAAVPDDELRAQLDNYLSSQLSNDPNMPAKDRAREKKAAIERTIHEYPEIIEYYIRNKEDTGDQAVDLSYENVEATEQLLVEQVRKFVKERLVGTGFYDHDGDTWDGSLARVRIIKNVVEQRGGASYFYLDGKPIKREVDLQLIHILAWRAASYRSKQSHASGGELGRPIVEAKLASNSQLGRTLRKLTPGAEHGTSERSVILVVYCYSAQEVERAQALLRESGLAGDHRVVIVNLGADQHVISTADVLDEYKEPTTASSSGEAGTGWLSAETVSSRGGLLLSDLKRAVARGEILAVIGAGISIHSTENDPSASWKGLLREGISWCVGVNRADEGWAARQVDAVESGDLEELLSVAEQITSKLGGASGAEYGLWLRQTVGALQVKQPDVLEALRDLGVQLATTNYDGLIEEITHLRPVTWRDAARVYRVLHHEEEGVLHFHGYWEIPDTVVLGIRSYDAVIRDNNAQGFLKALPLTKSLLFVGFGAGLSDHNFGALLSWIRESFSRSEYRHYRLARRDEVDQIQALHPNEERVAVVSYGESYDDLATFIDTLKP